MELRHLRYFVAVAEEGSVTKAAARLGIQQPPLGQQIRALEYELGVQLFERAPKRIILNPAGEEFLKKAQEILALTNNAIEHIGRFDKGERGRIAVGFTSSASLHPWTPKILRAFRETYPLAEIGVEERETYELILALQQKRVDAAFMHISAADFPDLRGFILTEEPMVVAIPRDHPFAQSQEEVTLKMLAGQPMVVYRRPDGPGIFTAIDKMLQESGVSVRVVDQVHRLVAAVNLVAAGRGLSLVPSSVKILHTESIVYRPLAKSALPPLPLYLAHRNINEVNLVENFIATAKRTATELARDEGSPRSL